jgi:hypothetical protein
MSDDIQRYVKRGVLTGSLQGSIGGQSRAELVSRERQIVEDYNKAGQTNANSAMKSYNKLRDKIGGGSWKASDIKGMAEGISGIDIGYWDNKKVQEAADGLLRDGHHPVAIFNAINGSIDRGLFDDSFFTKAGDPTAYGKLAELSATLSSKLTVGGTGNITSVGNVPKAFAPRADKTVDEIRKSKYRTSPIGRLKPYIPALRDIKNPNAAYMVDPETGIGPIGYGNTNTNTTRRIADPVGAPVSEAQRTSNKAEYQKQAQVASRIGGGQASKIFATEDSEGRVSYRPTAVVLPFDSEGNNRSWKEVVEDVNGRRQLTRLDSISNKEAEEAENNPKMQEELLARSNKKIKSVLKLEGTGNRIAMGVDTTVGDFGRGVTESVGNLVFGEDKYGSEKQKSNNIRKQAEESTRQKNAISLSILDDYLGGSGDGGVVDNVKNTFRDIGDTALETNTGNAVTTAIGARQVGQGIKQGIGLLRNAPSAIRNLMKPKPSAVSDFVGPLARGPRVPKAVPKSAPKSAGTKAKPKADSTKAKPKPKRSKEEIQKSKDQAAKTKEQNAQNKKEVKQAKDAKKAREDKLNARNEALRTRNSPGQKPRLDSIDKATKSKELTTKIRKWVTKRNSLKSRADKGDKEAISQLKKHNQNKPRKRI